ncbi:unnamed protein product [Rotaria magnacalcarata]|uniref:Uncharacterized protein n=1 Tax=Rotaria magnacalcarata TaxID=392030 RepID=A0A815Z1A2_9BILA|nr:unnamed protein product [Rotaria magnacalcarata]CAF1921465.1 unnamed protein product [Rotaria magnacalcarata]CAF4149959.1 unnamed protein product [Rotaria magnacalcarata]CAF4877090.1 unnamed protein product [Rotaria magnacalcarata]
MVRLQMLIDDLSQKIDTVLDNSGQMRLAASSIQYPRQSNFQQQQIPRVSSIRYNSPDYVTEMEATRPFIQLQQTPSTYQPGRTLDLIQAAPVVAQSQNIWFPSASSTQGPVAPDSRTCSSYSSATIDPPSIYSNWPLVQSQHLQHQSADQQRCYGNGQNIPSEQTSSTGASNTNRSTLTSVALGADYGSTPPLAPQYTWNSVIPNGYAYGTPAEWIPIPQQGSSHQTNIPPQINVASSLKFDSFQLIRSQQPIYEESLYYPQQSEQELNATKQNDYSP